MHFPWSMWTRQPFYPVIQLPSLSFTSDVSSFPMIQFAHPTATPGLGRCQRKSPPRRCHHYINIQHLGIVLDSLMAGPHFAYPPTASAFCLSISVLAKLSDDNDWINNNNNNTLRKRCSHKDRNIRSNGRQTYALANVSPEQLTCEWNR